MEIFTLFISLHLSLINFIFSSILKRQNDCNKLKILSLNEDSKLLNEQSNNEISKDTSTTTLAAIVDGQDSEKQQQKVNININSSILDESIESNVNSDESILNESNNAIDLINNNGMNSSKIKNHNITNRKNNHHVHTNNFYSSYYTRPDMI